MKTTLLTRSLAALGGLLLSWPALAQNNPTVVQESLDWKKFRVRPSISIYIPYVNLKETQITAHTNVEGHYDLGKFADVQAGVHFGSFNGFSAGGTLHLRDKVVNKSTKFKVGSSLSNNGRTETTTYYEANSDSRVVFGPTAHLRAGKFGDSGFYSRLDVGFDRQRHSRAYYNGFASNNNGFSSIRLMATAARFNQAETKGGYAETYESRTGAGGLVSFYHERRPWKTLTWYLGADLGYMKVFGVKDYGEGIIATDNNKANYIVEIKLGVSIGIL